MPTVFQKLTICDMENTKIAYNNIGPETLIENGFKKLDSPTDLFGKVIAESNSDDLDDMAILISHGLEGVQANILLPEGGRLWLSVPTMDDLNKFIEMIDRYEPVW